tara:strand:- start:1361 stop:3121 length:1761 start_codon:yes stop_codon:yes gene_type:complete
MNKKKFSVDEILNEFNNKSNLSDLISQFIPLQLRGNSFIGKCPFHNEKTPSFNVNNEKGLFYCFGCKVGGNAISFLSKYKNFSFQESIKYIADYAGINISSQDFRENSKDLKKYDLLKITSDFFQNCLKNNKTALKYLESRIGSLEIIEKFDLGFCPNDKYVIEHLRKKGFSDDEIKNSDLLIKNKDNKFFGRFKERIIFPIYSFNERIVGFGARSLIKNPKIKYINSQESEIFKKSNILYGLKQNMDLIRKNKEVILVEGYMDVISLYKNGIKTAVSTLGTTLSKNQIFKIWNLSNTPFVCFDGDMAGKKSAQNIAVKMLEFLAPGKSIKFINLPKGEDPDSFFINSTQEDFYDLKKKSMDLSELIWEIIVESIKEDTPEFLALLDDKISNFSSKVLNKIVSKEYYRFLKNRKDQYIWQINRGSKISKNIKSSEKADEYLNEKILIVFMIFESNIINEFIEEISKIRLTNHELEKIKKRIIELSSQNQYIFDLHKLRDLNENSEVFFKEIEELKKTHLKGLEFEEKNTILKQILNNLKLPELIKERKDLKEKILTTKDKDKQNQLIRQYDEILIEIKSIKNKQLE